MAIQSGAWNLRTSRTVTPDLEVLRSTVNSDVTASIVLDSSAVAVDPIDGVRRIIAGSPLTKNANNQYELYTGTAAQRTAGGVMGILCETVELPDDQPHADAPMAMWCHGQWFRPDRIVGWAAAPADAGSASIGADVRAGLPTCKFS